MNTLTPAIDNEDDSEEEALSPPSSVKLSLRGAVNAACKDCIYDECAKGEGSWRQQVEACTVTKCALYPVRPISKPRKVIELPSSE